MAAINNRRTRLTSRVSAACGPAKLPPPTSADAGAEPLINRAVASRLQTLVGLACGGRCLNLHPNPHLNATPLRQLNPHYTTPCRFSTPLTYPAYPVAPFQKPPCGDEALSRNCGRNQPQYHSPSPAQTAPPHRRLCAFFSLHQSPSLRHTLAGVLADAFPP